VSAPVSRGVPFRRRQRTHAKSATWLIPFEREQPGPSLRAAVGRTPLAGPELRPPRNRTVSANRSAASGCSACFGGPLPAATMEALLGSG